MIHLQHPEALAVVPLVVLVLRTRLWPRPLVGTLRVLLLAAGALLLAQPSWRGVDDGRDIVLVVDRSASMPADVEQKAREFANELAAALPPGDRLGVLTFGRRPEIVAAPQAPFAWPAQERPLDQDGSDLGAAITAALALVPAGRHGSVLVVSDGEHTSGSLDVPARAAARAGVRIDAMHVATPPGFDCAVVDVQAPGTIGRGEPFAASAVVVAEQPGPAQWRLRLDGEVVQQGEFELQRGRNVVQFRAALDEPGEHEVAVEVVRPQDARTENDRATAIVRALAPARILCITPGGRDDRLTQALRAAGFEIAISAPATAPVSLAELTGCRVVVLEDVAAGQLPNGALAALAQWVRDLGGGLLMTGGKSSFGVGGWHRSAVEDVLPVTMEIREEQRKFGLALAIALDCSGSMQAFAGGERKMTLANRGAASAIELLSPIDDVAVLSVDTAPEVVVEMQSVTAKDELVERVRSIDVGGGGIYVGTALHAAAEQLAKAPQQTKHLVLFADAADAEEPDDYRTFVPQLVASGITVSVIGLGSTKDSDAALLVEIANLGKGRCQFVADAKDLPRVFAEETIQVARSSVVEQPTVLGVQPALATLGDMPDALPQVLGYSLAWARPRAELDVATLDEHKAPFVAHWHIGLGRSAVFLGEADGALAGGLLGWDRYTDFFATLTRWLAGGQGRAAFPSARVDGGVAVFGLEVEPDRAAELDTLRAMLSPPDEPARELGFERVAPGRVEARVALLRTGTWRVAAQLGDTTVALPPVSLPYSPEFRLRADARGGERELRGLVRQAGGSMEPSVQQVLAGERESTGAIDLGPFVAWALVGLLLAEIAIRRLQVMLPVPRWLRWSRGRSVPVPVVVEVVDKPPEPPPEVQAPDGATGEGLLDALARAKRRGGGR
ncbi:MAG: VWA domain-containing protein [Planctomycetes bacterium]|nr:VWA domain-containing protein [Planctomycetota bacterium]